MFMTTPFGRSQAFAQEAIMKGVRSAVIFTLIFLSVMVLVSQSFAQETPNYSGNFLTRSTLTGDWGGIRNDWAKKGVTLDISLTQIGQGNVQGGKKIGWEYGGRGDITLNLDTGKMGLWPGGFVTMEIEGNFGHSVNPYTGALMPVNTNQIFPMPASDQLNMPALNITQFLSEYFGVFVGKIDTMTPPGGINEFAAGKGATQFMNLALNIDPVVLLTPYSTLAAGAVILPTKDIDSAVITVTVLDADGVAKTSGFDTVFKGNNEYAVTARIKTDFFGLTGHQLVGGTYSAKNYNSLDKSLRFFLVNRSIEQKDNSWSIYYNFDQYLYEPRKGQGIGIFGRFGTSDGNPNPFHYAYSFGVGGKGVIAGRQLDQFGLGFYYINIKNPSFTGPLATRVALRDEQGFEAYYNFAVTPWLHFTPDFQVLRGAQKQTASVETRDVLGTPVTTIDKNDINTATILGFRLRIIL